MSGSSPSDLALAFRSFPRRLREARGTVPHDIIGQQLRDIDHELADAAALLHSNADPLAIADAIDALPAQSWSDDLIGPLRIIALELGGLLRALEAANHQPDD
jgi:hypothetical protein